MEMAQPQICGASWKAGDPENQSCGSGPKTSSFETQGEWVVRFESTGRKASRLSLKMVRQQGFPSVWEGSAFLFYSGLYLNRGWSRPTRTLGGAICFTQSIDINVNTIQKIPSQEHVGCLTIYLGTMANPS